MSDGIIFQVETTRVLQILAREIYDSPLAMVRENTQNAYDAVRMRFAPSGELTEGGRIDITLTGNILEIADNGIGMTETVLRENFWKAGSSGKHTDSAKTAGVVGTFGIGAMANFGVCTRLSVFTKSEGSEKALLSVADRATLKIAEECISLTVSDVDRDVGTTVTAVLEQESSLTSDHIRGYILPYVEFLPVPVYLDDVLISCQTMASRLPTADKTLQHIGSTRLDDGVCSASFDVLIDSNSRISVNVSGVEISGVGSDGVMLLVQENGQLFGLRSYFGLAPIPAIGFYAFGGFANFPFLVPTAGREALSRESIELISRLLTLAERAASEIIGTTGNADNNTSFMHWLMSNNRYDLSKMITISALPDGEDVCLGDITAHAGERKTMFFAGTDKAIEAMYSNEGSLLLKIAQANPRRSIQNHYIVNVLHIPGVPDRPTISRVYDNNDLEYFEVSVLVRIAMILREEYLIGYVDVFFADITHGVTVTADKTDDKLKVYINKASPFLGPLHEFQKTAFDLFGQFMRDFVRVNIYPKIEAYVPTSARGGIEALKRQLQKNREYYKYEVGDCGDIESFIDLDGLLAVGVGFSEIVSKALSASQQQVQNVSPEQVGKVENEIQGIVESQEVLRADESVKLEPALPIMRDGASTDKRILEAHGDYPVINGFRILLGVSDSLMRMRSEFFYSAHTTRVIWAGHRVIYIFTESSGDMSLYYDIQLRNPINSSKAGSGSFPTTTLVTKNRIFIPVPHDLEDEFRVTAEPKGFYVRHDVISRSVPHIADGIA